MSVESIDTEVAIVGAGPAGLSAALVLGRSCRRVRVFDHGRPRNGATRHMHGYLTRDGISPGEFRQLALEELREYPSVSVEAMEIVGARPLGGAFALTLADGRLVTSRRLLLATGVVDSVPALPGFLECYGRSVFHCPYCDAWELRGRRLAVYGRGERGHGLSLELTGWTRSIVLCTDGDAELDQSDRARLARNGIPVRDEPIARLEEHDGQIERVVFHAGDPLECDALFFTTGQRPCSGLAEQLGCEFNAKGTVRTGPYESTHLPGLYVAGDASRAVQWVVVAAAEGAEAAYAINQDLIRQALL
jgi:thioredoxin reductase